MTKRNEPIGEVECPVKGCSLTATLYRYRERPHVGNRRFAGKLYCVCKEHGQLPCNAAGMQEKLLNEGKVWGPRDEKNAGATAPAAPAQTSVPPQKTPAKPSSQTPATPAEPPAAPAKKPLFSLDW